VFIYIVFFFFSLNFIFIYCCLMFASVHCYSMLIVSRCSWLFVVVQPYYYHLLLLSLVIVVVIFMCLSSLLVFILSCCFLLLVIACCCWMHVIVFYLMQKPWYFQLFITCYLQLLFFYIVLSLLIFSPSCPRARVYLIQTSFFFHQCEFQTNYLFVLIAHCCWLLLLVFDLLAFNLIEGVVKITILKFLK